MKQMFMNSGTRSRGTISTAIATLAMAVSLSAQRPLPHTQVPHNDPPPLSKEIPLPDDFEFTGAFKLPVKFHFSLPASATAQIYNLSGVPRQVAQRPRRRIVTNRTPGIISSG
jgi:hypothetical protein